MSLENLTAPARDIQTQTETAGTKRHHPITATSTGRSVKRPRLDDVPITPVNPETNAHYSDGGDSTYLEEASGEENTIDLPLVSESLDIGEEDDDTVEDERLRGELKQKAERAKELLSQTKEHLRQKEQHLKECVRALENLRKQETTLQKRKTAFCSLKRSEVCFSTLISDIISQFCIVCHSRDQKPISYEPKRNGW